MFFANSVDPDEMAHNEPSHQDLHCDILLWLFTETPVWNNGSIVLVLNNINPCRSFCVVSQWKGEEKEEIVEEMKERYRRERKINESEETEEIKTFLLYPYLLQG